MREERAQRKGQCQDSEVEHCIFEDLKLGWARLKKK